MMITSFKVVALALAVCPGLAIPPPEFGFVDSANHTELSVAFTFDGNTTVVQEGQLFGGNSKLDTRDVAGLLNSSIDAPSQSPANSRHWP